MSIRAACSFASGADFTTTQAIYKKYLSASLDDDPVILDFAQAEALDLENFATAGWNPKLDLIRRSYDLGQASEPYMFHRFVRSDRANVMPLAIATQITQNPSLYPGYLVSLAEDRCKQAVASDIVPVADIAEREGWFV